MTAVVDGYPEGARLPSGFTVGERLRRPVDDHHVEVLSVVGDTSDGFVMVKREQGGPGAIVGNTFPTDAAILRNSFESEDEEARLDAELERAGDELRRVAYNGWLAGRQSMGDLDLRAAAQHAQSIGDHVTERAIDSELQVREARA